jgi:uncharacterized protein YkwD
MSSNILTLLLALSCQQAQDLENTFLARLNQARTTAGLNVLTVDPALTKGCLAHAHYLVRNLDHPITKKLGVTDENPKLPGYTEEGRRAAKNGFAYTGGAPLGSLDWMLSTYYARQIVLHPDLKRIGLAIVTDKRRGTVVVIDLTSGRFHDQPVFYPVDKQKDVPLAYVGPENPNPIPKEEGKQPGFPITVRFPASVMVQKATATLKDGEGKEVPCWLSTPEKPAARPDTQRNSVALIPKDWLQENTTYTVSLSAELDGKPYRHMWSFTTGTQIKRTPEAGISAVDRVNAYRKTAGLDPVVLDPLLSKGCTAHAEYILKNIDLVQTRKLNPADEDPKLPGYSALGKRIARRAYIDGQEAAALIDNWMASLHQRLVLLNPDLRRIGVGQVKAPDLPPLSVLDLHTGEVSDQVVLFPADRQKDVPLTHGGENPSPVPDAKGNKAGFPITVVFPEGTPLKNVTAKLEDAAGKEVPAWLATPEKPVVSPAYQRNNIILVPQQPLRPGTTYTVTVKAQWGDEPWERKWSFTTGKK